MNRKYDIYTLQLYLERKLPPELEHEIDCYLRENPEVLDYLLELSKIDARMSSDKNELSWVKVKDIFRPFVAGEVEDLGGLEVYYRDADIVQNNTFQFLDLQISMVMVKESQYLFTVHADQDKEFLLKETISGRVITESLQKGDNAFYIKNGAYLIRYQSQSVSVSLF